jgi:hypothetical protein
MARKGPDYPCDGCGTVTEFVEVRRNFDLLCDQCARAAGVFYGNPVAADTIARTIREHFTPES